MAMPKATMNKNNDTEPWQNDVRLARQVPALEPKPVSQTME